MDNARAIGSALVTAMVQNDIARLGALYTPDAVVWHSTDQIEMSVADVLALVGAIASVVRCEVDVKACLETEEGFVQTQENTYVFGDGTRTSFHAALVVKLNGEGLIERLDEYLDSAGLTPVIAALS